jgi:hypothetical protein
MMKFAVVNTLATVLSVVSFALYIVSFSTPFYFTALEYSNAASSGSTEITGQTRINRTLTEYDVQGVTQELSVGTSGSSSRLNNFDWGESDVGGNVKYVFYLIKSFLIVGVVFSVMLILLVVSLFFRVVQVKLLPFPQKLFHAMLFLIGLLSFVGGFVAFAELMSMPSALDDDIPNCTDGFCKKFSGTSASKIDSDSDGTVDTVIESSWGPTTAFYTTLVAFLLMIPASFMVLVNKIPTAEFGDEEETGVAL